MLDELGRPTNAAGVAAELDRVEILILRGVGFLIDLAVLVAMVFFVLFVVVPSTGESESLGKLAMSGLSVLLLAYFPLTEGLYGRSLGKLVTGLIVVDRYGRPPGVFRAFLRSITRLLETNPGGFGGLPAVAAIAISKHRQRFGDMLAGTYVIPIHKLPGERPPD